MPYCLILQLKVESSLIESLVKLLTLLSHMTPCRATAQRATSGGLQAALDSWVDLDVSVEHSLA